MASLLLAQLLRTTATLSVAALAVFVVLRGMRYRSPRLHRIAWLMVLLSGWLFVRTPIVIPWYVAPPATRVSIPVGFPVGPVAAGAAPAPRLNGMHQPQLTSGTHFAPANQQQIAFPWPIVVLATWAIGVGGFAAWWVIGYFRFLRQLPIGTAPQPAWQEQWQQLLTELPVRRPIRLCITNGLGPLICRVWGEYRLLAPEALWRELTTAERETILRHELAHVARRDLLKSLLARILALPHWFNPLAWWAVRRFDECGEWACDDVVRRRGPSEATVYARVLLRLGQAALAYGAAIGGRRLSTRIQRLLTGPSREDSTMKKSMMVAVMVLLALAGAVEWRLGVQASRARADQEASQARRFKEQAAGQLKDSPAQVDSALLRNLADAAKGGYTAWQASYNAGTAVASDCYIWSRRWVEAEQALAEDQKAQRVALQQHRDRMEQLFQKIDALHRAGVRGGEEEHYYAAKFYLAEAEIWLASVQGAAKTPEPESRRSDDR